ncbi:MAG: isoprenylcysteine carboxylmethyltransferase family protein [Melioribacteraceae bacterium]|nr:isoprenylcysteine carboxylmethyltransferase family protein [Melioribacteraceae bacterium]
MKSFARQLFKYRGLIPIPFLALMLFYFNGNKLSLLIGLIFICIGELIRIWGVSYAGEITRTTIRLRADSLVTDGPYSFVRNPLYIGNIIIIMGFSVFTMALFPYFQIVSLTWFIFQYWLIIMLEEDFLRKKFGNEYENYRKNVPRFLPNIYKKKKYIGSGKLPDYQNAFRSETRTFQAIFSLGVISLIIYLVK